MSLARKHGFVAHVGAQATDEIGVDRDRLGDDVARAFERGLHVGDFAGHVRRGELGGNGGAVGEDGLGERPESAFARDLRLAAALRLVGEIEVFELGLGQDGADLPFEPLGQFAL